VAAATSCWRRSPTPLSALLTLLQGAKAQGLTANRCCLRRAYFFSPGLRARHPPVPCRIHGQPELAAKRGGRIA
jgi:hypothetical protein